MARSRGGRCARRNKNLDFLSAVAVETSGEKNCKNAIDALMEFQT
jgi:hypothetical protein